jgi:hypothetical protein
MVAYDIKIRRRALLPTVLPSLLAGLLWMGQAGAEEAVEEPRWYQVELIVFAHRNAEALDSERWPDIAGVTLPANLRRLSLPFTAPPAAQTPTTIEPVAEPEPFLILNDADLQLKDMAAKLARSKRFETLLHVAWRQPTLADEQTQPILLHDGMTAPYTEVELAALQSQAAVENVEQPPAADPAGTVPAAEGNAEMGPPAHRLVGTVRLSVARYLHLDADLLYRLPVTQKAAVPVPDLDLWYDRPYPTLREPQGPAYVLEEWQAVRGFRLSESRRMRSKEIHYLDHPFFGVVVLVTPLEKKD